jgi:hypothetical protein
MEQSALLPSPQLRPLLPLLQQRPQRVYLLAAVVGLL